MASHLIHYATLLFILGTTAAQTNYYRPLYGIASRPYLYGQSLQPYTSLQESRPSLARAIFGQTPYRRSESCSAEGVCMFVLLCIMSGGTTGQSCSGSLLSTCCTLPKQGREPSLDQNSKQSSQDSTSYMKIQPSLATGGSKTDIETTQRLDSTVQPTYTRSKKMPGNTTYCGINRAKPQSRIIGGDDAMYGEFPWQAHIKLNKQQCGGVLLNNYYVLTAAHCIHQVRLPDITIQLGVYDIQDPSRQEYPPQTFSVIEKKIHPDFRYQAAHPDRFDVALLKLDRAARFHEHVVPICLPGKDWDFQGWKGIITGWGKTDTGLSNRYGTRLLQKVDVPIISNDLCEKWHHEKGIDITISSEMVCAGYEQGQKDACVGDSGGPLMVVVRGRWVVVGLVSAGFGCAQSRQPGIYHRVPSTVDWLRDNIIS